MRGAVPFGAPEHPIPCHGRARVFYRWASSAGRGAYSKGETGKPRFLGVLWDPRHRGCRATTSFTLPNMETPTAFDRKHSLFYTYPPTQYIRPCHSWFATINTDTLHRSDPIGVACRYSLWRSNSAIKHHFLFYPISSML
jgi:hypothetical protein